MPPKEDQGGQNGATPDDTANKKALKSAGGRPAPIPRGVKAGPGDDHFWLFTIDKEIMGVSPGLNNYLPFEFWLQTEYHISVSVVDTVTGESKESYDQTLDWKKLTPSLTGSVLKLKLQDDLFVCFTCSGPMHSYEFQLWIRIGAFTTKDYVDIYAGSYVGSDMRKCQVGTVKDLIWHSAYHPAQPAFVLTEIQLVFTN